LDGDDLGRIVKAVKEGKLDWSSAAGQIGVDGAPVFRADHTASSRDLHQFEKELATPRENLEQFKKQGDRGVHIQEEASKRPIFDWPLEEISDEEAIGAFQDSTNSEIDTFLMQNPHYREFFTTDIQKHANPAVRKFVSQTLGKSLTSGELALFHIVSSLLSPGITPARDSSLGLKIFVKWLEASRSAKGYVPIRSLLPKSKLTWRVWSTVFGKLDKVGEYFGSAEKAVDWLTSHHPIQEMEQILGTSVKKRNQFLTDNGGYGMFAIGGMKSAAYALNRLQVFDVLAKDVWFWRTVGRMLGARLTDPRTGKLIDFGGFDHPYGSRVTHLVTTAWKRIGEERGWSLAQVQQVMWAVEHHLYSKFGYNREPTNISTGVNNAIQEGKGKEGIVLGTRFRSDGERPVARDAGLALPILPEREGSNGGGMARDVETDPGSGRSPKGGLSSRADSEGGGGSKLHSVGKGFYDPVRKIIGLIRGKADISTIAHETSGHWLHDVLKDHPKWGPVLEKNYGKFDPIGNRAGLERFAKDVEYHWLTSQAPRPELRTVFDSIRASMARIYKRVRHEEVPEEIRALFEGIDSTWNEEIAHLVGNAEKVRTVARAKVGLRQDLQRAMGAGARASLRRDREHRVPLDGGRQMLRLTPEEYRQFLAVGG
jgi:hypothetical protein